MAKRGLISIAAEGLGYQPNSLIQAHMKALKDRYLKASPQSGQAWSENYQANAQKLARKIEREPLGVQHAIFNHVMHTTLGGKTPTLKQSDAEMRKFMKGLSKTHGAIAQYYGVEDNLGAPPFDSLAEISNGGVAPGGGAPPAVGGAPAGPMVAPPPQPTGAPQPPVPPMAAPPAQPAMGPMPPMQPAQPQPGPQVTPLSLAAGASVPPQAPPPTLEGMAPGATVPLR